MTAPTRAVPVGSGGSLRLGQGAYAGMSIRASAGAVDVDVLDSTDGTGSPTVIDTLHIATGSTGGTDFAAGVVFTAGVWLNITGAGTATGSVRIA